MSDERSTSDEECMLYWSVPSKFYVGSYVPRWQKVANRTEAYAVAHELIESGVTTSVTLRTVEVIT